jgi:hypothetical protein
VVRRHKDVEVCKGKESTKAPESDAKRCTHVIDHFDHLHRVWTYSRQTRGWVQNRKNLGSEKEESKRPGLIGV